MSWLADNRAISNLIYTLGFVLKPQRKIVMQSQGHRHVSSENANVSEKLLIIQMHKSTNVIYEMFNNDEIVSVKKLMCETESAECFCCVGKQSCTDRRTSRQCTYIMKTSRSSCSTTANIECWHAINPWRNSNVIESFRTIYSFLPRLVKSRRSAIFSAVFLGPNQNDSSQATSCKRIKMTANHTGGLQCGNETWHSSFWSAQRVLFCSDCPDYVSERHRCWRRRRQSEVAANRQSRFNARIKRAVNL